MQNIQRIDYDANGLLNHLMTTVKPIIICFIKAIALIIICIKRGNVV